MNLAKLKELIIEHEGERFHPYLCSEGRLTIGIGHNLESKGISKAVSNLLFEEDIKEVLDDLPLIFDDFDGLPETVQMVLADMRFQLGGFGLRQFAKMIAAVNAHDWTEMIKQMQNSRWYKQTTNRASELMLMIGEME